MTVSTPKALVIAALPRLSRADLQEMAGRLTALLGEGDADGPAWVFSIVVKHLRRRGGSGNMPYSALKRSRQYPRFHRGAKGLLQFVDNHFPGIKRVEQQKVLNVLVGACTRYLENHNIPIGYYTLGDCMGRINQVIDDQFPGYMEAGLITVIVKGIETWA